MFELKKENLNIQKNIYQKKEIIFVEGDMIIPDSKPDFLKCICVSGIPTIYKKEVMDGKIRIDGNINTYIMYLSDGKDGSVRGINTDLDFSKIIDCEKAKENMRLDVRQKVKSVECKAVNERKIKIEVSLELEIRIFDNENVEIVNAIENLDRLQILKESKKVNVLVGEGNSKILGKDTIVIDNVDEFAEVLNVNVSIIDKDIKMSYNKVLTKADAEVKIVYLTEDNRINNKTCKIPIVGFIDIQDVSENQLCDVNYEIRNILLKANAPEEHSLYMEIETDVNCFVYEQKNIDVIQDVYSPEINLEINKKEVGVVANKTNIVERNKIVENVNLDGMENSNIINVDVVPNILEQKQENGNLKCEGELELNFMLLNSNELKVDTQIVKVPFKFMSSISQEYENSNINTNIEIGMQNYIIQNNNQVKCDIDFAANIGLEKNTNLNIIENIEENGQREVEDYSVIIYIVKKADTLWKIAKRFGSTIDDIISLNNIEDPNVIKPGQKLFIPKYTEKILDMMPQEKVGNYA